MGKEKPIKGVSQFEVFRSIKQKAKTNSPKGVPDLKELRKEVKAMDAKNRKP